MKPQAKNGRTLQRLGNLYYLTLQDTRSDQRSPLNIQTAACKDFFLEFANGVQLLKLISNYRGLVQLSKMPGDK